MNQAGKIFSRTPTGKPGERIQLNLDPNNIQNVRNGKDAEVKQIYASLLYEMLDQSGILKTNLFTEITGTTEDNLKNLAESLEDNPKALADEYLRIFSIYFKAASDAAEIAK